MSEIVDRLVVFRCNSGRPWPCAADLHIMKSDSSAQSVIFVCHCMCQRVLRATLYSPVH